MSLRNRRYFRGEEEDRFETEAFAHLNDEEETKDSKPEHEQESGSEDSEPEDVQDKHASDSDDEAPDDVGFHDSQQSVLSQLRSAMRQVGAEKQREKNKRKQLDAQFKEQKANKQEKLIETKLPEDFLESIDDVIPKKIRKTTEQIVEGGKKKKKGERKERHKNRKGKKKDLSQQKIQEDRFTGEYIAFTDTASGVQVADMRHIQSLSRSTAQVAADFRHNRLYGKNVKRESNQQRLAKAEKRRHRVR